MGKYILALDQGTTSSRAILFDSEQNILAIRQHELTQHYPHEGWVEQDPMEIWSTQYAAMFEVLAAADISPADVAGIGITNQRETTILWDKMTGRPIHNAIVWQCRRTADIVDRLVESGLSDHIRRTTGLVPDAYFSGTKIKWLLDHVEGAREKAEKGEILFGTVDSWLVWKLTGGRVHITDATNAARTMIFDIHSLDWDDTLLKALDIPRAMLPRVCSSSEIYGYVSLPNGEIPIAGIAGDQQAALFGQTCFNAGDAKNTYGTGCFLLMNTGDWPVISKNGLLTTIAAGVDDQIQYALEGSVFVAGAAIQWLRDDLRMIDHAAESEEYCKKVKDSNGIYVVPAFTGLAAPYWDPYARGVFFGVSLHTTRKEMNRAIMEGCGYGLRQLSEIAERVTGNKMKEFVSIGGGAKSETWAQIKADITGKDIIILDMNDMAPVGAALLAGVGAGVFKDVYEASDKVEKTVYKVVHSSKEHVDVYEKRYQVYTQLYPQIKELYKIGSESCK